MFGLPISDTQKYFGWCLSTDMIMTPPRVVPNVRMRFKDKIA